MESGPLPHSRLPEEEPASPEVAPWPPAAGPSEERQTDLQHFLEVVKRRKGVVLACMVLIPAAVYFGVSSLPKSYEASVTVQVQPSAIDTSLFEPAGGVTPQQSAVVTATAKLAQTLALAAKAVRQLGDKRDTPSSLLSKTTVETDPTSAFIIIRALDPEPVRAAEIANALARAVVTARASQARSQVQRTIDALTRQIDSLSPSDQTSRSQLSDQVQRLRAVEAAQGDNAQIVTPASIPGSPAHPRPLQDTILAFVLALLFSLGLAFALERLNRRIRSPYDFETLTGIPLLGTVPASAFHGRDPASTHEAFQMIRATMLYFNQHRVKTILVTSPGVEEGKTTVAVNLALSLARSGKRVIIVDCDLRRPQVASRLKLDHVDYGLSEILSRERPLHAPLAEVRHEGATLRVIPAGTPPANPSDLLNSSRMRDLLYFLAAKADFVVLDSTPLLRVSDAIPLLPQVSGIVGLARVDQTRRDDIRRFQEIVNLSGGKLLGIVASGVRGDRERYGYGYRHEDPGGPRIPAGARPNHNGASSNHEASSSNVVEQEA